MRHCLIPVIVILSLGGCFSAPTVYRDYLAPGAPELPDLGAYGYVVFTARPRGEMMNRYLAVCESYRSNLEPMREKEDGGPEQHMVTYWPLVFRPGPITGCRPLVEGYDYALGQEIASAVSRLSSAGPVLVALRQPYSLTETMEGALVFDLSDFDEEDIDRAFRIWKDRISRGPDHWSGIGFRLVLFRESLRNLLQRYGDDILLVIRHD